MSFIQNVWEYTFFKYFTSISYSSNIYFEIKYERNFAKFVGNKINVWKGWGIIKKEETIIYPAENMHVMLSYRS